MNRTRCGVLCSAVVATAALAFAGTGCSDDSSPPLDQPSSGQSSSGGPGDPTGERPQQAVSGACAAVSDLALQQLGVQRGWLDHQGGSCRWRAPDATAPVRRELSVEVHAEQALGSTTGTSRAASLYDAGFGLESNPGLTKAGPGQPVPISGLGDQAKIIREWSPRGDSAGAVLVVRVRNLLIGVTAVAVTNSYPGPGVGPTQDAVETPMVAAAVQVLTNLGDPPARPTTAPAYGADERRQVRLDCAGITAAPTLAAGAARQSVRRHDAGPADCSWSARVASGAGAVHLHVEAAAPSVATGQSATAVAESLYSDASKGRASVGLSGASAAAFGPDPNGDGGVSLTVRAHNVLINLEYVGYVDGDKAASPTLLAAMNRVASQCLGQVG